MALVSDRGKENVHCFHILFLSTVFLWGYQYKKCFYEKPEVLVERSFKAGSQARVDLLFLNMINRKKLY